jgi:hypothetical protein
VIARYQALRTRIALELEEVDRTYAAIQRHWEKAKSSPVDQDAYLNSVALNISSLYSGLERVFGLIAAELDGGTLGGESWHRETLKQMTLDLESVRPPVLQSSTAQSLDEYRKFRHLIRNIYATNLDVSRMDILVTELPMIWENVRQELEVFSEFLKNLAESE